MTTYDWPPIATMVLFGGHAHDHDQYRTKANCK